MVPCGGFARIKHVGTFEFFTCVEKASRELPVDKIGFCEGVWLFLKFPLGPEEGAKGLEDL